MKRTSVYFLLAAMLLLAGCGRGSTYVVKSTLKDARLSSKADTVMVLNDQLPAALKAPVSDGAFSVRGKVKGTAYSQLSILGGDRRMTRPFIAEKGTITFQDGLACGTPLNDETFAFTKRLQGLKDSYSGDELGEAIKKEFLDFIAKHPADPCAYYAIHLADSRRLPGDFMAEIIEAADPAVRKDPDIKNIYKFSIFR